jgi:hypothetical protein
MRDRRAFFLLLLGAGALAAHSAEPEPASGGGTPVGTICPASGDCDYARVGASAGGDAGSRVETRKTERVDQDGSASFDRTIADECGNGPETGATDRRTGGGAAAPGR